MASLVADLLEFSRVRSGEPHWEPVDTSVLARELVQSMDAAITETSADVQIGELPTVRADRTLMRSLLQNLLSNAIKFRSTDAPRIRISAERRAAEWVFSVQDNGIGFGDDDAERIFEMFRRLRPRAERPGNGVGLALAREVVERHGGDIWARGDIDRGAVFSFSIPDGLP